MKARDLKTGQQFLTASHTNEGPMTCVELVGFNLPEYNSWTNARSPSPPSWSHKFGLTLYNTVVPVHPDNEVELLTAGAAAKSLWEVLNRNFQPGSVSVGVAGDKIIIYEHVRGLAKRRTTLKHWGFDVEHKYIGKVSIANG